jgi:nucleoporin POM152
MAEKKPDSPQDGPLIPDHYIDIPSQRFYYLSLGCLCQVSTPPATPFHALRQAQAIKMFDFLRFLTVGGPSMCSKWIIVDSLYCVILAMLKIPRLRYSYAIVLLQVASMCFMDGLMFGGVKLNISTGTPRAGSSLGVFI